MKTQENGIRVLVARTIGGACVVLTTNSSWIGHDCENISYACDDIGLDEPPAEMEGSLFLWEGTGKLESSYTAGMDPEPPEPSYNGTIRPVTMLELPALLDMAPPPDFPDESVQGDDSTLDGGDGSGNPGLEDDPTPAPRQKEVATLLCTFQYTARKDDAEEFIEVFPEAKLVVFEDAVRGQCPTGRIEVPKHRAEEFRAYAESDVIISSVEIL